MGERCMVAMSYPRRVSNVEETGFLGLVTLGGFGPQCVTVTQRRQTCFHRDDIYIFSQHCRSPASCATPTE